ncbi:M15 family metallopeptidase [Acetobacterium woodii]|uniref:D-alanyl-D-alanine carboxypeptidase DacB2 n=1 Tax=Acetobacterium woodii (strain ATCC 29683 / DSM 1030 / JCM 2381 / KCTC 1655 / WB1) TaxID=931626 RepID=H6LD26_ACEWD|nr:M15 family metallopeptidase [Acetobacterium woodii]AFA47865.1 D-alanyl-D-alanine carboxypeptidase DacB2 [Acetobacterium woodii DSM 1030]
MRIKDKKRFVIACSGLVILLILIIVVVIIGFGHKNNTNGSADNQKNLPSSAAQTPTSNKSESATNSPSKSTETTMDITTTDSLTMLVNKNHPIPESYVPADLITVDLPSTRDTQLRTVAAAGLTKLFDAASEAGLELYCCSGYRSYETQSELYDWNVSTYGVEGADLVSAQPGKSEHQLGLAMDVTSASVDFDLLESFGTTAEGQFIKDNAYKYGFIVRYPQGKTDITGYAYEPWHLRYLGVDVATDIYNSGKTMEEYFGTN